MSEPSTYALVAEDDIIIALMIEEALSDTGLQVAVTHSGDQAIAVLESDVRHQLLITDIRLGDGTQGWAVAARARTLHPEIQVIYITGDSMDDWRAKGVPQSVLLGKPFLPEQIVTAAMSLLNQPEAQTTAD